MTRYYVDTEFIDDGRTIDLISIGIVCEDGREYYAQNTDAHFENASDWLARNVLPRLTEYDMGKHKRSCERKYNQGGTDPYPFGHQCSPACEWRGRVDIEQEIRAFCDPEKYGKPEFWGYYCDYDWVAICQLHGRMIDLPKGWPMYCMDLKQWCKQLGDPKLPEQGKGEHDALSDAKWNKQAWEFLSNYSVAVAAADKVEV